MLTKFFCCLAVTIYTVCTISCRAADISVFEHKELPERYKHLESDLTPSRKRADRLKSNCFDLTKLLPKNYVKDASVDYSEYLQQGINQYSNVIFPDFPILVNENGLELKSNSIVICPKSSRLVTKSNGRPNFQTLRIFNVSNVKLFFPVIEGDRYRHLDNKGEWGMGISIANSSNIEIVNPKIKNCWGDGIYIGRLGKGPVNQNIIIHFAELDNNRRNGCSIVSVKGLTLNRPIISNTNGTMPSCGIDIEPNDNTDEINNVNISYPVTFNNAQNGLHFVLSGIKGRNAKAINIRVINHIDDGSKNPVGFYTVYKNPGNRFNGKIEVIKSKWFNYNSGKTSSYSNLTNGLQIHFSDTRFYKKNSKQVHIID